MATPAPGTIPALSPYQPGALTIAGTELVEIASSGSATAAVSGSMLITDLVGKAPSAMPTQTPNLSDLVSLYNVTTKTPYGAVIGNIAAALTGNLPIAGGTGQLLSKVNGANFNATWTNLSSFIIAGTGIGISGSTTITVANATGSGLSVLGVTGVASAIATSIVGSAGQILRVNDQGTAVGFGAISLASSAGFTGTLPVSSGGSGTTTLTANAVLLGEGSSTLGFATIGTGGRVLIDQGAASNPSFQVIRGDISMTSGGTATVNSIGGVSFSLPLSVSNGGQGTTTLTAHGVLIGEGTSKVAITSVGTTGFVLTGVSGADPTFQDIHTLAVTNVTAGGGLSVTVGTTNGAILGTGTLNRVTFPTVKTALYTALTTDLGQVIAFSTGALATAVIPQANATSFGPGWFVDLINFGGTTIVVAPITSNLTGIGATTGLNKNQSLRIVSDGTNYQSFAACGPLAISLTNTAQVFSGGVRLTPFVAGTTSGGTSITLDSGNGPVQILTNNGTGTITAPANSGEIDLLVINAAAAGALTFANYSVGANTGDTYTTTNALRFYFMSRTISTTSTYRWAATA
jgi:hypothetical protein